MNRNNKGFHKKRAQFTPTKDMHLLETCHFLVDDELDIVSIGTDRIPQWQSIG